MSSLSFVIPDDKFPEIGRDGFAHGHSIDFAQTTSVTKKSHAVHDKDVPHNMGKSDLIRASDFHFLMVLGKGSFGKVSLNDLGGWSTREMGCTA